MVLEECLIWEIPCKNLQKETLIVYVPLKIAKNNPVWLAISSSLQKKKEKKAPWPRQTRPFSTAGDPRIAHLIHG